MKVRPEDLPYGPKNPDYRYDEWRDNIMFEQQSTEATVKLCKDCAHFRPNDDGGNCHAPQNIKMVPDFVNGGLIGSPAPKHYYRAQNNRESEFACGETARWFTPIEQRRAA